MTTGGEGGMVTCHDAALWSRMWSFKDHGKSHEAVYARSHPAGFRWLHESFGTNWRMLEMQAVIGRIQLTRMQQWTAQRHENAAALIKAMAPYAGPGGVLRVPQPRCADCIGCAAGSGCVHAQYKLYSYVRPDRLAQGWSRDRIIDEIAAQKIPCYQGSCSEVYLERAFDGTDWRPALPLPVAKELGETSLMFLVHPTLTAAEIAATCAALANVLAAASVP